MTTVEPRDQPATAEVSVCPKCGTYAVGKKKMFACGSGLPCGDHRTEFMQTERCKIAELERRLAEVTVERNSLKIDSGNYRGKCALCMTANCDMLTDDHCVACDRDAAIARAERATADERNRCAAIAEKRGHVGLAEEMRRGGE